MTYSTVRQLSALRQLLYKKVTCELLFGEIKDLYVTNGEPLLDPPPTIIKKSRYPVRNNPPRPFNPEATLSQSWIDFFVELDEIKNGWIDQIKITNGEPRELEHEKA